MNEKPTTQNALSRRSLLLSGLGSLCALSLPGTVSAQGYGRGRAVRPIIPREDNPAIAYDPARCQRCEECRLTCEEVQTVKGFKNIENDPEACTYCGQCVNYCPNGALTERYHVPEVAQMLTQDGVIPIALLAPSVPTSVGEMYRLPIGLDLSAPLAASLRKIGFRYVIDASAAADLTVLEEASELVRRLSEGSGPLPLITSCCPAHVRFCELFYPALLPHLSTTKSPLMMAGALVKTRLAEVNRLDPEKIVTVAFAPCTAKKYEITLPFGASSGRFLKKASVRDVDFALTTRETAYLLHAQGERLTVPQATDGASDGAAKDGAADSANASPLFDPPFGGATEAGTIFGNTGGVAEAVLRTAYRLLNNEEAPESLLKLEAVRGMKSVREAQVDLKCRTLRVAVVHGLGNAREFFDAMNSGVMNNGAKNNENPPYDVVEVMACRGGCIGGGGQPPTETDSRDALRKARVAALYHRAEQKTARTSGENPEISALYRDFLTAPLSETAVALLHR